MGQVHGWERPLWFAPDGVVARDEPSFSAPNWWQYVGQEARAAHAAVALFEMSTYSKFQVTGADATAFLDRININRLPSPGRVALGLMLNQRGGIVGDLIIAAVSDQDFYVVGASVAEDIYRRWMARQQGDLAVTIRPVTAQIAALGVVGANTRGLFADLSDADFGNAAFPFMAWRETEIGGVPCRALRLSYAGELGWELHCAMHDQAKLFAALTAVGDAHGLRLAGSRALSHLRLEKGYRSWGAEINPEISPAAAGLARFCRPELPEKAHTIGREAVLREAQTPPPKSLATLVFDAPNTAGCWGAEPVFHGDACVGYVTSGGYGWRVDRHLAVAYLPTELCVAGTEFRLEILGKDCPATLATDPVYDPENTALRT